MSTGTANFAMWLQINSAPAARPLGLHESTGRKCLQWCQMSAPDSSGLCWQRHWKAAPLQSCLLQSYYPLHQKTSQLSVSMATYACKPARHIRSICWCSMALAPNFFRGCRMSGNNADLVRLVLLQQPLCCYLKEPLLEPRGAAHCSDRRRLAERLPWMHTFPGNSCWHATACTLSCLSASGNQVPCNCSMADCGQCRLTPPVHPPEQQRQTYFT